MVYKINVYWFDYKKVKKEIKNKRKRIG